MYYLSFMHLIYELNIYIGVQFSDLIIYGLLTSWLYKSLRKYTTRCYLYPALTHWELRSLKRKFKLINLRFCCCLMGSRSQFWGLMIGRWQFWVCATLILTDRRKAKACFLTTGAGKWGNFANTHSSRSKSSKSKTINDPVIDPPTNYCV